MIELKIAITGKGGVGKTTITALLAQAFVDKGYKLFVVDADPSPSLGYALGIEENTLKNLTPISEMLDLIEERTGVRPGSGYGAMFKLNPQVDDIPDKYSVISPNGIKLLVVGTIKAAEGGCFCPENALVKRLLKHLILSEKEILIMDMEAGIEHLGRGTVKMMDLLIIVLEPGLRSIKVAEQIRKLGEDLGIKKFGAILNKVQDQSRDELIISEKLSKLNIPIIGTLPFNQRLVQADLEGTPIYMINDSDQLFQRITNIQTNIESIINND